MGSSVRPKMSRQDRAKQFMPFAALKGYEEELKKREKIVVPRIELSEERKEELDQQFAKLKKKDIVTAIYFCKGEYLKVTGMVSRIDADARLLVIVSTKIPFEDLYEITQEKREEETDGSYLRASNC